MSRFADHFLRAKAWQVFLLFFVLFSILLAVPMPDRGTPTAFIAFVALAVISEFCFLAWLWSMGSFLSSITQPASRLNVGLFRLALVYPPLYIVAFLTLFEHSLPALFLVIIPLHLFAMFCMLYTLYFVSKSLVLAEKGEPGAFIGSFFLIWFFPVGVWIIQPRINRLYAERGR